MEVETRLEEVAEGVHQLRLPIPFEDGYVSCFLFSGGGAIDLLDCGMNSEESLAAIRRSITAVGGEGARLRRLVVTHIHPDHYGAAGVLRSQPGVELYLHRLEVPMVHPRYLEMDQLLADVRLWLLVNGAPEAEVDELSNASRGMRDFVTPVGPDVQLEGAETIQMGGRRLRVIWTPGHSPGHICLFDPDDGLLFCGDQLLPDITPNIGLHPQSTPDPLDEFLLSLERLARLQPALVLPAHGHRYRDAVGRVRDIEAHHARRKLQIMEIVGAGTSQAWEVALRLWGRREHPIEKRLALQEALAHLQSLAVSGRLVKRAVPGSVTWSRA
ncbi:MAG: MBL fold metallo-hydrolase [Candidatus Dormibacteraceae bacterium]